MKNIYSKNIFKIKYFLTYDGYYYILKKRFNRCIYKSISFRAIYDYIIKNNICLRNVYLPFMSLFDFTCNYASFEDERSCRI